MSWTTPPTAGSTLRASVLSALVTEARSIVAVKTTDDTRTSTTYIADTHLSVAIPAAATYTGQILLIYNGPSGGTNGRLKVRINYPSGALTYGHDGGKNNTTVTDGNMTDIDIGAAYNDTSSPTADINFPTVGTSVELTGMVWFTLVASAAGTVSLDTAQISASGTTTIRAHSSLQMWQTGL